MSNAVVNIKAPFTVSSYSASTDSTSPGYSSGQASSVLKFSGKEMSGTATGAYVLTYHPDTKNKPGFYWYDGQLVFQGTIKDKQGDVVFRERGKVQDGVLTAELLVESETASGGLRGVVGAGSYTLDTTQDDKPEQMSLELEF